MRGTTIDDYSLFAGLTKRQKRRIERLCVPARFRPGRAVMTEGQHGRNCMVIVSGTVVVERHGDAVAELGEGSVVGEVALLDGADRTRTATVTAVDEVEALVFTTLNFEALIAKYPTVAGRIEHGAICRVVEDTTLEYAD